MATSDEQQAKVSNAVSRGRRAADYLGLERNVVVVSAVVFLLGFGEELWKKFLPKYLEALGAGAGVVGLFGTTKDFFDAVYQYPGGWLADRVGRRRAFLTFIALASAGYLVYLLSPSWPYVFLGLALSMSWHSMASPAVFAVIGDALPKERRAMGFTLQSMLKRVPMAVAPLITSGWSATSSSSRPSSSYSGSARNCGSATCRSTWRRSGRAQA